MVPVLVRKLVLALSFLQPLASLCIYIIVFFVFLWDRILPSPHNSMTLFKSYRLIKVIDWLLGAWLFPPVYLPVLERVPVCTNVW